MDRHAGMCLTTMGREMSTCVRVGMLCVLVPLASWPSVKMMCSTWLHCFSGYFFAHLPLTERLSLQNSPSSCGHSWAIEFYMERRSMSFSVNDTIQIHHTDENAKEQSSESWWTRVTMGCRRRWLSLLGPKAGADSPQHPLHCDYLSLTQCKSHVFIKLSTCRTCLVKIMLEASASSMIQYISVLFVEILFLRLFSQEWIFLIFPHLPGDLQMPLCTLYCGSFEWWGMNMSISDLNEVSLTVSCWFVCSRINSEVQYSSPSGSVSVCRTSLRSHVGRSWRILWFSWLVCEAATDEKGRKGHELERTTCKHATAICEHQSLQDDSEAALSWMNLNHRVSPFLPFKAKWKFCRDHLELKLCQAKLRCEGTVWAKVHWGCEPWMILSMRLYTFMKFMNYTDTRQAQIFPCHVRIMLKREAKSPKSSQRQVNAGCEISFPQCQNSRGIKDSLLLQPSAKQLLRQLEAWSKFWACEKGSSYWAKSCAEAIGKWVGVVHFSLTVEIWTLQDLATWP